MIDWFLNLKVFEQIIFVVTLASLFVIITKSVMVSIKFYGIDKLNSEPETLENYEDIANNDSDITKYVPRFMSVLAINIFLASFGGFYFVFKLFSLGYLNLLFAFLSAVVVFVLYAVFDYLIKKGKKQ